MNFKEGQIVWVIKNVKGYMLADELKDCGPDILSCGYIESLDTDGVYIQFKEMFKGPPRVANCSTWVCPYDAVTNDISVYVKEVVKWYNEHPTALEKII